MLSMLQHKKGVTITELDGVKFEGGRALKIKKRRSVLFIAKNRPLAMFITKWLAHRVDSAADREFVLERLHVLFAPFEDGPQRYAEHSYSQKRLEFEKVKKTPEYDLVVIDEAHHVFKDDRLRAIVEPYLAPEKTRCLLLSDVSQSLRNDIKFPLGLFLVYLVEVVRSSKRIVAGAMQFQTNGGQADALETKCHHESEGPPLKSFLFDIVEGQDRFAVYAEQTLRAVQHVTTEFEGLSLHDRLAIIVPSDEFRSNLLPLLSEQLAQAYPARRFKLVSSEEASCLMGSGSEGAKEVEGFEWVIVDEINQMDGLERLIVIGVGLDAAANDDKTDGLETRSMLYRAMTRAHMMVLVVNEFIQGGWFSFLTTVKLAEDKKFDEEAAKREAEQAAAERAKRNEEAMAKQKQLDAQTEATMAEAGELSPEATAFVTKTVMAELRRGKGASEALQSGLTAWEKEHERRLLATQVAQLADTAHIKDSASVKAVQKLAESKLPSLLQESDGQPKSEILDNAAQAALDAWQEAETSLTAVTGRLELVVPGEERTRLLITALGDITRRKVVEVGAAVEEVVTQWYFDCKVDEAVAELSKHASSQGVKLDAAAHRALRPVIRDALKSEAARQAAAEEALELWRVIDAAVAEAAQSQKNQRPGEELPDWIRTADLVSAVHAKRPLEKVLADAVAGWEQKMQKLKENQKTAQSVWDSSGNETINVAAEEPGAVAQSGKLSEEAALPTPVASEDESTEDESSDEEGSTPLHKLMADDALTEAALMEACERAGAEAWAAASNGGWTPLHSLMKNSALTEALVAAASERAGAEAWAAADSDGRTPLHKLMENSALTEALVAAASERAGAEGWRGSASDGRTP
eukprot:COSAG06_NODE_6175_length_3068_cov_1.755136_1_plen_864_part_10